MSRQRPFLWALLAWWKSEQRNHSVFIQHVRSCWEHLRRRKLECTAFVVSAAWPASSLFQLATPSIRSLILEADCIMMLISGRDPQIQGSFKICPGGTRRIYLRAQTTFIPLLNSHMSEWLLAWVYGVVLQGQRRLEFQAVREEGLIPRTPKSYIKLWEKKDIVG